MSKRIIVVRMCAILLVSLVLTSIFPVLAAENHVRIERTTVNGMNILLQKTDSELVEITLLLKSGSGLDPSDKKGVADIMNELVRLSLRYNKYDLGDFNVETYPDYSLITIKTTANITERALAEVKSLLSYPLYSYDVITDLKGLFSTDIKGRTGLFKSYYKFTRNFYGAEHPYNDEMDPEVINSIRGADIYKWYRQTYQPGNAILSISGGCNQSISELEKFFTDMRSEQVDRHLLIQPVMLSGNQEIAEEDPNSRATSMIIGFSAPRIQDPEYPAFRVIAYYLEEFQHYFEELRVKEGLFYTEMIFYNYLEKPKAPSMVFGTMTDPESFKIVTTKTLDIVNQLIKSGIDQQEIDRVVKAMKSESSAKIDSGKGLAYRNALSQYLQTQLVYEENLWPKLEQVKADDIKKAAAKYLGYHIEVSYTPKKIEKDL